MLEIDEEDMFEEDHEEENMLAEDIRNRSED